jgi:hypothetical protein
LSLAVTPLRRSQLVLALLGMVSLSLGILVYVVDRPSTAVYFVPDSWQIANTTPLYFGTLGDYLPAFLHVLAFALFSAAITGRRYIALMCAGWFVAELFFEVAQMDAIAIRIAAIAPAWFAGSPVLENISSHFLTGQFDKIDVLFLLLGCVTAFVIGYIALPRLNSGPRLPRSARLVGLLLVVLVGLTSIVGSGGTGEVFLAANTKPAALVQR